MLSLEFSSAQLLGAVLRLLVLASVAGYALHLGVRREPTRAVVANLNHRLRAWWVMAFIFGIVLVAGGIGSVVPFALISFLALREFITLTPTRRGDHRALFWTFFVFLPLQYAFVATRSYELFAVFIPVYAFLLLPIRSAAVGQVDSFLVRTAAIQWGLMVCVYCVSHAPALLMLDIPGYEGQNAKLLFFLVVVVQLGDLFRYLFGTAFGRKGAGAGNAPHKTVEGLIWGILAAALAGTLLWRITPFNPWQAFLISLLITILGFAGALCMSVIKNDRRVRDYGMALPGQASMLNRIDSLCFAAPIFFHIVHLFFAKS